MLLFLLACQGSSPDPAAADDTAIVPPGDSTDPGDTGEGPLVAGDDCGDAPWGNIVVERDRPYVYVLAGSTGGDGTSESPFATIEEGVAAAGTDGIVAIGEGRYPALVFEGTRATLAGRCPSLVHVEGDDTAPALAVATGADVTALALTLTGGTAGVAVDGASFTAVGIAVADNAGDGLTATDGAVVTITYSDWTANAGVGVRASGAGTTVHVADGFLTASGGGGVAVRDAAAVDIARMEIESSVGVGLLAFGEGARITLDDSRTTAIERAAAPWIGYGAVAGYGGSIALTGGSVRQPQGPSVLVFDGGTFACDGCDLTDGWFANAVVLGGTLSLTNAIVQGGVPDPEMGGEIGIYATDERGPGSVILDTVWVDIHAYAGLWLEGAGRYDIRDSDLWGGDGAAISGWPLHGNAIFARDGVTRWDGASGLRVTDSHIQNSATVGVLLHDAAGTLSGTTWENNVLDLVQQHCVTTTALGSAELDGASADICPDGDLLIDSSLAFDARMIPAEAD